jgi:Tol biopolymer transport system component
VKGNFMRRYVYIELLMLATAIGVGWQWLSGTEISQAQSGETISLTELEGLPPYILVTIDEGNRNDLAYYDWQQEEIIPVVASDGDDSHGTWSPDRQLIAFQTRRGADWEIFVYDVETGEERNITDLPSSDMYPNWTRDERVIHMSDRSGEAALWITDPADGTVQDLTANDTCRPDYHPNYSPVADRVAYRADCSGNGDIWRYDIDADERTNLTADSLQTDRYPVWSPDGERILFVSHRDGNQEIYVMDADGSNVQNLTNNLATDAQGSWSPDGRFIIFISTRNGQPDLWIMDADGGRPTLLASTGDVFNWPWWQPFADDDQNEGEEEVGMGQGNADVEFVRATLSSNGIWRFDVTVHHPDTGWEDYANGWNVVLPDGTVLKSSPDDPFTRLLLHPHETEQPFTRSQSGLRIPEDVTTVTVRAHDLVDGWGGREIIIDLTEDSGEGYEVQR